VALGSNWSTWQQSVSTLKAAEAQRAELISKIDLRVVEAETTDPYDSIDSVRRAHSRSHLPNPDLSAASTAMPQRAKCRLPLRTASTTSRIESITS
jgi:hypothetical protein